MQLSDYLDGSDIFIIGLPEDDKAAYSHGS